MANLNEIGKGITFFIFVTIMAYFLWNNIFSNIIEFVGTDVFSIGADATDSIVILKTIAWVSFVLLYLAIGGVYLLFTIISGSKGEIETHPTEFLIALGLWSILMPFLTFIYGLVYYLQSSLATASTGLMDASSLTLANQFSWLFALIELVVLVTVPFIFVIKGYGVNLFGKQEVKEES